MLLDRELVAARAAYDNFLEALHPDIANKLRDRYEQEEKEFAAAAKSFCPSLDVAAWAKDSCKHCHGRGYTHIIAATGEKKACSCAVKRFQIWLKTFRLWYNALKDQTKKCKMEIDNKCTDTHNQ